jgi:aminoglycoside phosphotransferase (APT) family kinase protein
MEPSAVHRDFIVERFPHLAVQTFEPMPGGWDCFTYEVNGEWVFQFARLPGSDETLRRQIAVLPELSRELSAPVPVPELVWHEPVCMGYRKIEGTPLSHDATAVAGILPERLGRFLYDLHLVPPELVGLRTSAPAAWRERLGVQLADFRERVVPLLDPGERTAALEAFDGFIGDDRNFRFATGIVHADLGPEHVLAGPGGDLAGVIDWGDAGIGDPAIDFAWLLHAEPVELGDRALAAYGGPADERFLDRVAFYHRIGPWHEVVYGIDTARTDLVDSGLAGVRERSRLV